VVWEDFVRAGDRCGFGYLVWLRRVLLLLMDTNTRSVRLLRCFVVINLVDTIDTLGRI